MVRAAEFGNCITPVGEKAHYAQQNLYDQAACRLRWSACRCLYPVVRSPNPPTRCPTPAVAPRNRCERGLRQSGDHDIHVAGFGRADRRRSRKKLAEAGWQSYVAPNTALCGQSAMRIMSLKLARRRSTSSSRCAGAEQRHQRTVLLACAEDRPAVHQGRQQHRNAEAAASTLVTAQPID